MKKFSKILICLLLCVFSLGFVACKDKRTEQEKAFTYPNSADAVLGNGGLAVQKGNYLYYVNGFKAVDSEEHTQDGSYTHGALMLMKLNSDGSIVTDENNLIKDDYYITMSNRLCGFEATSLYIAGDYLYFTSPSKDNTKEDSVDPIWAKDYVEFYRIKLDKTSEPERIYQAGVKYSEVEFEYYSSNNNVFILVYEKGKNIADQAKLDEEEIEAEDVKENALYRVSGSGNVDLVANKVDNYIFSENAEQVFYKTTDETDHILTQYNVISNEKSTYATKTATFTIDYVSNNNVYITYNGNLCASNIASKSAFVDVCYTTSGYDKLVVDNGVVIAIRDNEFNFFGANLFINKTKVDSDVTSINFIGCVNGCVIYFADDNKTIKCFSYANFLNGDENCISTLATVENIDKDYLDLQEDYIYFYKTAEGKTNKYLHRLKVSNNLSDAEEMVGVYLEEDKPEIEKDEVIEE